jgi:hypothetical protein
MWRRADKKVVALYGPFGIEFQSQEYFDMAG